MNSKSTLEMFLTRTELTAHEYETIGNTAQKVRDHSLAVGAFVTRYGREEVLAEAADLYLSLLAELTNDLEIRTGALEYGLFFAQERTKDKNQARQLQGEFLVLLYQNAIADRKVAA
jgi:hypothetical protein